MKKIYTFALPKYRKINKMMIKKVFVLLVSLFLSCGLTYAQSTPKSALQQRAETDAENGNVGSARFHYIRAFEDYINKGQTQQGVDCGVKATALYYKENYFKEAFDLLRRVDDNIDVAQNTSSSNKSGMHYLTAKERMQMYMIMRRGANVLDQLKLMDAHATASGDEGLKNDLLYNKAVYYYSFGMNAQGNAVFKEMADKLTASKEYDKVDEVYKTLIDNGRKSGSANLVAQSYKGYMAWKDSVSALKTADQIGALKKKIADHEASIEEKDSSLSTRQAIIVGLCILAAALAAALVLGAIVLMRFILLTRKQKKTIEMANENNALKAKFISNISAQLEPTLKKLDMRQPEVKSLVDFSDHIQTLSKLENEAGNPVELEEVSIPSFCDDLMDQIRNTVKPEVNVTVNAPKMSAKINKEYVAHILHHLLANAAEHTPEGGSIWLDFKKRGAHTCQFLVSNTGEPIPEEKREDVFKPFLEIHDLTKGDGLGLPICKRMAVNMDGDLVIDSGFTKGTRFVLDLHV